MRLPIQPVVFALFLLCGTCCWGQEPASVPPTEQSLTDDWAAEVISNDPMEGLQTITLDDLRNSLSDAQMAARALERHFDRTQLSDEQAKQFLSEAIAHPDTIVRQLAAEKLQQRGWLSTTIRQRLLTWIRDEDATKLAPAIVALQHSQLERTEIDSQLIDVLIGQLDSEDSQVRLAAEMQLFRIGAIAVPQLLDVIEQPSPIQLPAAGVLSRLIAADPAESIVEKSGAPNIGTLAIPPTAGLPSEVATVGKGVGMADGMSVRERDDDNPQTVRVFFGTNRQIIADTQPTWGRFALAILIVGFCTVAVLVLILFRSGSDAVKSHHYVAKTLAMVAAMGIAYLAVDDARSTLQQMSKLRQGVQFGGRRTDDNRLHYGYCDVSIPPTHSIGKVERPLFSPENEAEHVVLKECQTVPSEEFFAIVGQAIGAQNATSRDCLIYVHGFNVSFDEAARRAAQIHIDLQFQGATLFYSWPSRGQVQAYFSDRNEIVVSKGLLTSFIREVHSRLNVDRLHIIAHSMGADATAQAILDLDPQAKILDQIVLAAPDIDAVYFQSILPRLNERSSGTTLYCSKNDWALLASRRFNDSVRAGDSSLGPLVVEGLDTIDASYMDTEMLGHSYYGNCLPLLEDLQQLIKQASPPRMRKLEEVVLGPAKAYWVFGD